MNREQKAVITAAKAWYLGCSAQVHNDLAYAVSDLMKSEEPKAVVFPDPQTGNAAWQNAYGYITAPTTGDAYDAIAERNPEWRKLRVTYTPMDEPTPAERITQLEAMNAELCAAANDLHDECAKKGERIAQLKRIIQSGMEDNDRHLDHIAELEALVERRNEQLREANLPESFDDSALLWGVLYDGLSPIRPPLVMHCSSELSARKIANEDESRRVVRLRVIEMPE